MPGFVEIMSLMFNAYVCLFALSGSVGAAIKTHCGKVLVKRLNSLAW